MAIPFPEPWMRDRVATRTLAILAGGRITTEHGEVIAARSWPAVVRALFAHDLVLYADLGDCWDAIDDDAASISTREDGGWIGVAVRQGRKVRHVYDAELAWGRRPSPALLADMRTLYAHFRVRAAPSTASGLGIATMRRYWSGETMGRPTFACWKDLHDGIVGGRVDTLQPGRLFPTLYELDINGAYPAAAARPLPGGAAVRWDGGVSEPGPAWSAATGYYWCRITIHHPLTLGPVVLRGPAGEPNVIPSQPGEYSGWLWSEDVAALRAITHGPTGSVTVVPLRGWYWRRWARAARITRRGVVPLPSPLADWSARLHRARRQLVDGPRQMAKLVAVAAIGRFGAALVRYRIVRERLAPADRQVFDPLQGPVSLWIHADERDASTALAQVASYIQASVRRQLWAKALPYAEAGGLVATNYDALYVSTRPGERSSKRAGGWKLERLQDAVIPAARSLRSASKVRLPGVPLAARSPLDMPVIST